MRPLKKKFRLQSAGSRSSPTPSNHSNLGHIKEIHDLKGRTMLFKISAKKEHYVRRNIPFPVVKIKTDQLLLQQLCPDLLALDENDFNSEGPISEGDDKFLEEQQTTMVVFPPSPTYEMNGRRRRTATPNSGVRPRGSKWRWWRLHEPMPYPRILLPCSTIRKQRVAVGLQRRTSPFSSSPFRNGQQLEGTSTIFRSGSFSPFSLPVRGYVKRYAWIYSYIAVAD
nr:uncharacterized protein LOC109163473 [Ipomoea batatas]